MEGLARGARTEGLASDARAFGEARDFSGRESVDGLTAPPSVQKTGDVQELLCPEQTRSLEPLVSTDKSTSQAHKLTETSGQDKGSGPLAVGELDAVEDSLRFVSNDSEAATSIVPVERASTRMEAYPNSSHDSLHIIIHDKGQVQGETYPLTSSVTGHPVDSQSALGMHLEDNAETNVTTTVGQWPSNSYENSGKGKSVENLSGESCCYEQRKLADGESCCLGQRKLPEPR